MASGWYVEGKDSLANKEIDLTGDTLKVVLVDTALYAVDLATHSTLADIAAGARLGEATLVNPTFNGGVLDADDVTISGMVSPASGEALVIYDDTVSDRLLLYIDSASSGLPTPAGISSAAITWHASGIATL